MWEQSRPPALTLAILAPTAPSGQMTGATPRGRVAREPRLPTNLQKAKTTSRCPPRRPHGAHRLPVGQSNSDLPRSLVTSERTGRHTNRKAVVDVLALSVRAWIARELLAKGAL